MTHCCMNIESEPSHPLSSKWQFLLRSPRKKGVASQNPDSAGILSLSLLGEVNSLESLVQYVFYLKIIITLFLYLYVSMYAY